MVLFGSRGLVRKLRSHRHAKLAAQAALASQAGITATGEEQEMLAVPSTTARCRPVLMLAIPEVPDAASQDVTASTLDSR